MPAIRLGRVQLRIMQVLWQRGQATAREITEALHPTLGLAHSTVQTLLRKMEDKGVAAHEVKDRTFIFRPLVDAQSVTQSATRDLIDRMFGGSVAGLFANLLNEESISPGELKELKELIDKQDRKKGRLS